MSQCPRRVDCGEPPSAVSVVSDCAAITRGAATRLPTRLLERHGQPGGDKARLQLDSGLDSGYQSSQYLTDEGLSQRSLSLSGPCDSEWTGHCKPAAGHLDSGVDLSGRLAQVRLDERQLSDTDRQHWQQKYVDTLGEAFRGDEDGDTHLHLAIIYGFREVAESLIRLVPHPNFLNLRNSYMQTPLHLAVLTGDAQLCRHLVVAGAELTWCDRHGNTPLHLACHRADRAAVHALTEPVSADETHRAAPRYAVQHTPVAAAMLDDWNYQGLSCLHLAVMSKDLQISAHLICHNAAVNVVEGKSGRTPLHLAVEQGNIEILRFLVDAGSADVDAETYGGLSSYQLALLNGRHDVAELLVLLGAAPRDLPDSDMDTSSDSSDSETKPQDTVLAMPQDMCCADIRIRGQPLVAAQ